MKAALHERIRADFESRILSGVLAPGERLPTEHDLMGEYGCSRMTVSKALSSLNATGLIERRKRAGTFVSRPRVHSHVLDVPDLSVEVSTRGQVYRYVSLVRKVRAPSPVLAEQELAGRGRLVQLDGLHLADGMPLAFEQRLVSARAVPAIAASVIPDVAPGTWLLQHVPWTEAETRIHAVAATVEDAKVLGVVAGTACLCIERRTWRGPERITDVRQLFLGGAYDLTARFGPTARPTVGDE